MVTIGRDIFTLLCPFMITHFYMDLYFAVCLLAVIYSNFVSMTGPQFIRLSLFFFFLFDMIPLGHKERKEKKNSLIY
jgi:hypothetical protein